MKKLMQLRVQGTEPDTVVVNLTGKPLDFPNAYIAEPNGSIKSLYAANVVVVADGESLHRVPDALYSINRLGVSSLSLILDGWLKWTKIGSGYAFEEQEKMIGAYTESQLKDLAGDDWNDIKNSPEILNTFSYLCLANKQQIEAAV